MSNFTKFIRQNIFAPCVLAMIISVTSCSKEPVVLPTLGTCQPVVATGHLTQSGNVYTFQTNSGGSIVLNIDTSFIITHSSYPGLKIELWGLATHITSANHENLNGKHIKDRIDLRRTIIFADGAKITLVASSMAEDLATVSIYDGAESHHINASCKKLEYSATDAAVAQALDDAEPDGEAGAIEFTSTGWLFVNIYQEDDAGNKVMNRVPLGKVDTATPNTVTDYYDDPRLGHT